MSRLDLDAIRYRVQSDQATRDELLAVLDECKARRTLDEKHAVGCEWYRLAQIMPDCTCGLVDRLRDAREYLDGKERP